MRIKAMEAHLRARGHDVERDYLFEGQDTHDGAGWVVRVDGEVVASGDSPSFSFQRVYAPAMGEFDHRWRLRVIGRHALARPNTAKFKPA